MIDYDLEKEEEKISFEELLNADLGFQEWILEKIKETKEIQMENEICFIDN